MNRLFIVTENNAMSFFSKHHDIRLLSSCGQLQERFNAVNGQTTERDLLVLAFSIQSAAVNHECDTIMIESDNELLKMFVVLAAAQMKIYDIGTKTWYHAGTTGPYIKCIDLLSQDISADEMQKKYFAYLKRKLNSLDFIPSQASC